MRRFSISDIETITGIKAHTIRIWEQRYEFIVSKRTETNIRYYDDKDLCLFLNISNLTEHGFKISEIARMSPEDMMDSIYHLSRDHQNPCQNIHALTDATLEFDTEKFLNTFCHCTEKKGLQATMIDTVFPFLRKMGLMWQTGAITPAHEHFISDLIKRKLICAIDSMPAAESADGKKFMLFLPEGETHEIGLLFAHYVIKSYGNQVLYLGQNIPYENLDCAALAYNPDFCVTTLSSVLIENGMNKVIDKIAGHLNGIKLIVSGPLVQNSEPYQGDESVVLKNMPEFSEFINSFCLEKA